jgi:hypothetical protein
MIRDYLVSRETGEEIKRTPGQLAYETRDAESLYYPLPQAAHAHDNRGRIVLR